MVAPLTEIWGSVTINERLSELLWFWLLWLPSSGVEMVTVYLSSSVARYKVVEALLRMCLKFWLNCIWRELELCLLNNWLRDRTKEHLFLRRKSRHRMSGLTNLGCKWLATLTCLFNSFIRLFDNTQSDEWMLQKHTLSINKVGRKINHLLWPPLWWVVFA